MIKGIERGLDLCMAYLPLNLLGRLSLTDTRLLEQRNMLPAVPRGKTGREDPLFASQARGNW